MDTQFQINLMCAKGPESPWLRLDPILAKDSGAGLYGFCPYCKFRGRTMMLKSQSVHCGQCKMETSLPRLLTDSISYKVFKLKLLQRSENRQGVVANIMVDVVNYYRFNLLHNPGSDSARRYIADRGINAKMRGKFKIGFAPGRGTTLDMAFPESSSQHVLQEQSLVVADEYGRNTYDRFSNRIIFPIHNILGDVIGFGGRIFDFKSKASKYLNSAETSLFNKSEELYGLYHSHKSIRKTNAAIVVEGYIDVVSLHQAGFSTAVATMGTSLTRHHGDTLYSICDYIYLCFDADKAGVKAIYKAIDTLIPCLTDSTKRVLICVLPEGEDPDSIIRTGGAKRFKATLENSVSPAAFIIQRALKVSDITNLMHAAKLLKVLQPLYSTGNKFIQADIITHLSNRNPGWTPRFLIDSLTN